MNETGPKERRPKFRRGTATPLRLTADDIAVLTHVAEHRFLSSRHVISLLPHRSPKKLVERLGELYHAGYLDRPRAQLMYYATTGSAPMVYALGNKGVEFVSGEFPDLSSEVDWTWKNRSAGSLFIAHTLMTADVMVAVIANVRRSIDIRLIAADEISKGRRDPFVLKAQPPNFDRDVTVIPDAAFGLERLGTQKFFFLESDRATMPIVRTDPGQTSIARKFSVYLAGGGARNSFGTRLGISNFRVLTVTSSRERMTTMIATLRDMTGGAGSRQFLFADADSLRAAKNILSFQWLSGKGDRLGLLD